MLHFETLKNILLERYMKQIFKKLIFFCCGGRTNKVDKINKANHIYIVNPHLPPNMTAHIE